MYQRSKRETNLDVKIEKLIRVYSKPDRDPRGHTITVAFLCVPLENSNPSGGDDATGCKGITKKNHCYCDNI